MDSITRETASYVVIIIGTAFGMAAGFMQGGWTGLFTAGAAGCATLTAALGVNGKVAAK